MVVARDKWQLTNTMKALITLSTSSSVRTCVNVYFSSSLCYTFPQYKMNELKICVWFFVMLCSVVDAAELVDLVRQIREVNDEIKLYESANLKILEDLERAAGWIESKYREVTVSQEMAVDAVNKRLAELWDLSDDLSSKYEEEARIRAVVEDQNRTLARVWEKVAEAQEKIELFERLRQLKLHEKCDVLKAKIGFRSLLKSENNTKTLKSVLQRVKIILNFNKELNAQFKRELKEKEALSNRIQGVVPSAIYNLKKDLAKGLTVKIDNKHELDRVTQQVLSLHVKSSELKTFTKIAEHRLMSLEKILEGYEDDHQCYELVRHNIGNII